MPHYLDQPQPTRRRPSSTTPLTSEKQNSNSNINNANRALEIRAALQRQQEMVRRIKEVQALSSSPSIQSAFAPSISSTKPRKQKAEFHFRTRSISTEPPKVELQDLSATTGTAKGVSRFDTKKKTASTSTTPVVNDHKNITSSSSPTPQPADSYSTTPISQNISLGLVATNNNSGANLFLNETTTSTSSSSLQQQQLLHSSSASATISHLQQSFIQQQQFQAQVLGRSSSPIAARIFSESNNVRKFTNQLNDSKQKMEKQTRVEPTAVVQHDDIRATKMTKKETQRANFLRGVLGEKKLPPHHHQNNTASRTRSSTSPHRRPNSAAPPGSHADGEAEQEDAKKRLLFSAQRVLTPNPDILPNPTHLSPQHHRFVSTPQGAKCLVKPSAHTPTDFTRGTCKVLCQYKSLQNAVKKISGAKNVVFSALEAQVIKKKASSVGGEQGDHHDDEEQQEQEQNSAVVALAEISKRRTGLVRKT